MGVPHYKPYILGYTPILRKLRKNILKSWLVGQGQPSEKYDFVNWDDAIPNINGKIKKNPNHQPESYGVFP